MPSSRDAALRPDHVLGTSLELLLAAPDPERAGAAVLAEFDRRARTFGPYDPDGELPRLNRAAGAVPASADLQAVLAGYDRVGPLAGGALNPLVGALARVWADAERTGVEPARPASPGWPRGSPAGGGRCPPARSPAPPGTRSI